MPRTSTCTALNSGRSHDASPLVSREIRLSYRCSAYVGKHIYLCRYFWLSSADVVGFLLNELKLSIPSVDLSSRKAGRPFTISEKGHRMLHAEFRAICSGNHLMAGEVGTRAATRAPPLICGSDPSGQFHSEYGSQCS
jgi:hypothetical protein